MLREIELKPYHPAAAGVLMDVMICLTWSIVDA